MNMKHRKVDLIKDNEIILKFHCEINYECENKETRNTSFQSYYNKWISIKSQTNEFLGNFKQSLCDARTLADIIEDDDSNIIAYIWVKFIDVKGYEIVIAEIEDLYVAKEFRGRGISVYLMQYIEKWAFEKKADILRSGTGASNHKSIKMHENFGFKPYRIEFEKIISKNKKDDTNVC
ncbi:TPA: hypothetical protein DCW38_01950 [candidate division WOR-3 bacterium]|uniref:N-acetyltransferase domain-containing protein n=1 Tax=candidate division WOR-3 bacterium TaxID=2052148 RepID=A0A350H8R2_UNCW3|nr:hypothetical protein [candidate division WOR-3 bacterium]